MPTDLAAKYDYCIVGAGPGGLQLGQFMLEKGRDYKIFERQMRPGSFFARFPTHRELISINKRNTGRTNPEFNRRHDWNSLVGHDEVPTIPNRTAKRYPPADTMVEYLQDFAKVQEEAGHIAYGTSVNRISRDTDSGRFWLDLLPSALDDNKVWYFDKTYQKKHEGWFGSWENGAKGISGSAGCGKVVMANGLWLPNIMPMRGIELADGYESLPPTGEMFEGKTIAIMGMGNSAFEAAKSFDDFTNFVHIWPTRGKPPWPWVSWESRYSGSLRATTAGSLDGYLLDTLDVLGLSDFVVANDKRMMIVRCYKTMKCLLNRNIDPETGVEVALLGYYDPNNPWQRNFVDNEMERLGLDVYKTTYGIQITQNAVGHITSGDDGIHIDDRKLKIEAANIVIYADNITETNIDAIMEYRAHTGDNLQSPYDHIIRATGWKHNVSVYDDSARPLLQSNRKYPRMTAEYESVNVPGMYFAGTYSHAKDFKRGAAGDIKGFRYTAHALSRVLSQKYHEEDDWDTEQFCLPAQQDAFAAHLHQRINEAAAPYILMHTMGDGVLFERNEGGQSGCEWHARYQEEVPIDYFHTKHRDSYRMWWSFGFDGQHRKLNDVLKDGTGFEPWIWYYPPRAEPPVVTEDETAGAAAALEQYNRPATMNPEPKVVPKDGPNLWEAPQYKELFRLEENVHSDWSNDYAATALKGWLSDRLSDVFAGVTGTQASMAAALNPKGGPKLRHDAKAFQRTGTGDSSLAQFKPLELDLTVVNHLRATLSIGLNNKRVGSMNGCLSKTLTVSDGDVWQLSAGSMKMQWVVTAEKGIYQEVHIGEPPAGQPDPCFPDIATYEELMGKPPLPSKGSSLFTEP